MKEKLMVKKTKVIAFRVNADEYEALAFIANARLMKMGEFVFDSMLPIIEMGALSLNAERKKAEAKAKRLAKKEAASGL
jgi:hypothetical protein